MSELRFRCRERFGSELPNIRSRDFLLHLFAWQVQAAQHGGHHATTEQRLQTIAAGLERSSAYQPKIKPAIRPGVVLTREWKGIVHKVTARSSGFDYRGRQFKSLSDVARHITGTRWSGPRFFGLEAKKTKVASKTPA